MTRTPHLKTATAEARGTSPSTARKALEPYATPQMQHLRVAQARLLEETQTFLDAWFDRRHRMTQAMGDLAIEIMDAGTDGARISDAMSRWHEGAGERLHADVQDWLRLCTSCASHLAREASEAETEMIDNTVEMARRAGTVRHATPV